MKKHPGHHSKEFFIDGRMVIIRPLQTTDPIATMTYARVVAEEHYVTLGELQHLPDTPVMHYCKRSAGFVFVALSEQSVEHSDSEETLGAIGLALYVKNDITGAHEMSIVVTRNYVATRLPHELAETIFEDAANHQVNTLYTVDTSADNRFSFAGNQNRYVYSV